MKNKKIKLFPRVYIKNFPFNFTSSLEKANLRVDNSSETNITYKLKSHILWDKRYYLINKHKIVEKRKRTIK